MYRRILVSGGLERPNGFELGDGKFYEAAKLCALDLESGETEELLSVSEGNEHYPEEHPNLQFTAGCFDGDRLWLPTDTELRCYTYPGLVLERTVSHPFFQNIHSVHVIQGKLVATSTGLDLVAVLDPGTGEPLELINAEGKDTWHRFFDDVDYRLVHSTRPHDVHPNFVFEWDGAMWVTRCGPEDAVCLSDFSKRIDISGDDKTISVHDGHVVGERVYFTSVDGCLCVGDPETCRIVETIDLMELEPERVARGWCRGFAFDGDLVHVGFSRFRKTRNKGKLAWLTGFSKKVLEAASVVTYDLVARKRVREYLLPEDSVHAIYGVLGAPS